VGAILTVDGHGARRCRIWRKLARSTKLRGTSPLDQHGLLTPVNTKGV
jgi:hypothetical protein